MNGTTNHPNNRIQNNQTTENSKQANHREMKTSKNRSEEYMK
jgi:hypothetical protein